MNARVALMETKDLYELLQAKMEGFQIANHPKTIGGFKNLNLTISQKWVKIPTFNLEEFEKCPADYPEQYGDFVGEPLSARCIRCGYWMTHWLPVCTLCTCKEKGEGSGYRSRSIPLEYGDTPSVEFLPAYRESRVLTKSSGQQGQDAIMASPGQIEPQQGDGEGETFSLGSRNLTPSNAECRSRRRETSIATRELADAAKDHAYFTRMDNLGHC
ncbi:hypothetical protein R1flu_022603 [Riccia fluitans]|uniref:Uncharacterized protein n=1 Tax=Riccia fluitans TaxID=41844 RepID=A0ABD1XPQ9_9MARC